jgi:hypothetical protein
MFVFHVCQPPYLCSFGILCTSYQLAVGIGSKFMHKSRYTLILVLYGIFISSNLDVNLLKTEIMNFGSNKGKLSQEGSCLGNEQTWGVDSSYNIQTNVSVRRDHSWGISIHSRHKERYWFSLVCTNWHPFWTASWGLPQWEILDTTKNHIWYYQLCLSCYRATLFPPWHGKEIKFPSPQELS